MTYNLLRYPQAQASSREPRFKQIIEHVNPDILIVQEITSPSGVTSFQNNVLGGKYKAGTFIDGYDMDNALFYKDSLFTFLSNVPIPTQLRDISIFTLVHNFAKDTIIIHSAHLKAGSGSSEEQRRLNEVNQLRLRTDQYKSNTCYILVGDLNLYTSEEPAYQRLMDQTKSGYFLDPLNRPGSWGNNPNFADIHTQSTRVESLPDGGSSGGLDDRFDFILISQGIKDSGRVTYLEGSYTSFGNDGSHFNKSINTAPYNVIGISMANALYLASDHLPVFADFEFEILTDINERIENPVEFYLFQNYPNPFNPETIINFSFNAKSGIFSGRQFVSLKVFDILGREISVLVNGILTPGTHSVKFDGTGLSSGVYFYALSVNGSVLTRKMQLIR